MKKKIIAYIALIAIMSAMTGCGAKDNEAETVSNETASVAASAETTATVSVGREENKPAESSDKNTEGTVIESEMIISQEALTGNLVTVPNTVALTEIMAETAEVSETTTAAVIAEEAIDVFEKEPIETVVVTTAEKTAETTVSSNNEPDIVIDFDEPVVTSEAYIPATHLPNVVMTAPSSPQVTTTTSYASQAVTAPPAPNEAPVITATPPYEAPVVTTTTKGIVIELPFVPAL